MISTPSTLERLAAYNFWAYDKLLNTLESLMTAVPDKSMELLCHLVNAQVIWLSRIENNISEVGVFDSHSLAECRTLHQTSSKRLQELAALEESSLNEIISYTNTKGDYFQNSIQDILIHVFNHGTYHRAQIARDLRQNNLEPVNTDYITFVREN